jgi:hypothetical protein
MLLLCGSCGILNGSLVSVPLRLRPLVKVESILKWLIWKASHWHHFHLQFIPHLFSSSTFLLTCTFLDPLLVTGTDARLRGFLRPTVLWRQTREHCRAPPGR